MRTFDACSDAGEHAFPVEVRVALATLSRRLGDVMLVGSWARDVCLVLDAWLDPGRMTDDLDVATFTNRESASMSSPMAGSPVTASCRRRRTRSWT